MFGQLNIILQCILSLAIGIIISMIFTKLLIKIQINKKLSQPIREELTFHSDKKNTPTLGGISIFFSSLITLLIVNINSLLDSYLINIILSLTGFFVVGLIDDLSKILFKNYKGLKGSIRLLLEIMFSIYLLLQVGFNNTSNQYLNVFNHHIYLGLITILIFIFIIVGSSNAMNLSDGLDGLATSLFMISLMPFIIYSFKENELGIGLYLIGVFGSCFGFLIFNIHPSKIFMGDCGSLFLGSVLGIISVYFHLEYILLIVGVVLIIETLSVIIQVIYYKLTKKRIFLMAPLHHHFEMMGFSEEKVVLIFIIVGYLFSLIGVILII